MYKWAWDTKVLTQPKVHYSSKYFPHAVVFQFSEGDVVEVSRDTRCDWITPSTRGPHGAHEVYVNQTTEVTCEGDHILCPHSKCIHSEKWKKYRLFWKDKKIATLTSLFREILWNFWDLTNSFAIIPSLEVHPLSDQFDRRLCSVSFQCRHVQIVDEKDEVFPKRWSKDSLSPDEKKNFIKRFAKREKMPSIILRKVTLDRPERHYSLHVGKIVLHQAASEIKDRWRSFTRKSSVWISPNKYQNLVWNVFLICPPC